MAFGAPGRLSRTRRGSGQATDLPGARTPACGHQAIAAASRWRGSGATGPQTPGRLALDEYRGHPAPARGQPGRRRARWRAPAPLPCPTKHQVTDALREDDENSQPRPAGTGLLDAVVLMEPLGQPRPVGTSRHFHAPPVRERPPQPARAPVTRGRDGSGPTAPGPDPQTVTAQPPSPTEANKYRSHDEQVPFSRRTSTVLARNKYRSREEGRVGQGSGWEGRGGQQAVDMTVPATTAGDGHRRGPHPKPVSP